MKRRTVLTRVGILLPLWVGAAVLAGCQKTAMEAAEAPVEEASAEVEANEALELDEPAAALGATQPAEPVAREQAVPAEPARAASVEPAAPAPARTSAPIAPPRPEPVAEAPPAVTQPAPPAAEPLREPAPPQPVLVTVPAGTLLAVEMQQTVSSHTSQVGEKFRSVLTQDVAAQGRIALPKGTAVLGRVTEASPAAKIGGRARLALEFYSIQLDSARTIPLNAVFAEAGKSQAGKDAAIIGGSVVGGAILGEAIDEGEGTKIGAIVGGIAGAVAAKKTKGKPVEVPTGSLLTLELTQPVTVEVYP